MAEFFFVEDQATVDELLPTSSVSRKENKKRHTSYRCLANEENVAKKLANHNIHESLGHFLKHYSRSVFVVRKHRERKITYKVELW